MTNKIIIDAWNVCWKIPEIAELIPDKLTLARQKFNALVKTYFQRKSSIYKIIYDGQTWSSAVWFYPKKNPSIWTIISSDRELTGRARNLGVNVVSSEDFIFKLMKSKRQMNDDSKKSNPNLSKNEINDWLDLFNNQN